MTKKIKIFNDDFINILPKIKEKINLCIFDLPYGQTDCKWDIKIDLKKMWDELINICSYNCIYIFFTTTKFGYELINSKKDWFRYDLVWEKSNSVGFLNCKKLPLRKHEMIYIFCNQNQNDIRKERNKELRNYAKKIKNYIKDNITAINKKYKTSRFLGYNGSQFTLPLEKNYNNLVKDYDIKKMEGYLSYNQMKEIYEYKKKSVYNPQKSKGKPYTKKEGKKIIGRVYGGKLKDYSTINNGDRYPTSIIKYNHDKEKLHSTQKPVQLIQYLIKTYSNENDTILDITMGSGSTGIASYNTNRNFIGIEKDMDIFKIAYHRLLKNELSQYLI